MAVQRLGFMCGGERMREKRGFRVLNRFVDFKREEDFTKPPLCQT